ncbi:hypothetical protein KIW84_050167 [Lathyrus oleraceus]|uniref:GAG-pre-integrase domain-containing protein n=1 Tax=Pisum sativum TaxID=3888 RepID=A0A9D5ABQ1_PEA|nr:hypothetical protein KIW84_050167 [Pisum sativum]
MGHLARDCRSRRRVEETSNFALESESNEGFLLMAQKEEDAESDTMWYLDSGASNHMCGHKHLFKELKTVEDGHVSFGDASKVKVEGKGTICFLQKKGVVGSIEGVYYVPNLKANILSLGQLTEKGYSILMEDRNLQLKDKTGRLVALVEIGKNRMYKLNLKSIREKCLHVNVEDQASLWHLRFGHLHQAGLRRLDVRVNEASRWDWSSSTEALVEEEEEAPVVMPTDTSTEPEDSDDENEPSQPRLRSLQDLYENTEEEGSVELKHVASKDQAADILTKPLSKEPFDRGKKMLGMIDRKSI